MARNKLAAFLAVLGTLFAGLVHAQAARTAYVCPGQVAGQVTVFDSPVQICAAPITTAVPDPFIPGLYEGLALNISGANQATIGIADGTDSSMPNGQYASYLSYNQLTNIPAGGHYYGLDISKSSAENDPGGGVNLVGVGDYTSYSGVATPGSGFQLGGFFANMSFQGTGTVDFVDAFSAAPSVQSGTVGTFVLFGANAVSYGGDIQMWETIYNQFSNNGSGTIDHAYVLFDDADSCVTTCPASPDEYLIWQSSGATNHPSIIYSPFTFHGAVNFPTLTAGALTYTNGSGALASVTIGSGLTFSGGTLSASGGGGGTVTSISVVAPLNAATITTTGTVGFPTETANTVLAGPTTGSAATPTFRALVAADLPAGTTPTGANPTGTVGLSAVNGSATTFLRSDGAPPLSQAIAPNWSAAHQFSVAGAASTPGVLISGAHFTGGNGTTTMPQLLVQDSTATASSTWSTTGTAIGINAHSTIGLLTDLKTDGTSKLTVDTSGNVIASGNLRASGAGIMSVSGGVHLTMGSGATIGWSSTTNEVLTADTVFTRSAAAVLHLGAADAAAPVAQTLGVQGVVAGTSNTAGALTTIAGSVSTGTGVGGALAFATTPAAASSGTAQNAEVVSLKLDGNEHLSAPGGAPAVTSCGTGSPSVSGSDIAGTITVGTTATACTLTFKIAYVAAPHCTITDQSVLADVTSYTIGTTTIVLTMTSNTGDKVNYVCLGA